MKAAERFVDRVSDALNAIGSLLIALLTMLVCADVGARALMNQPVRGVPELAQMSIVAIVYLQAASSLKAGRWAMADLFLEKLPPRSRQWLQAAYCAAGAAFFTMLCMAVLPYIADSYANDDYIGVPPLFTVPTWPVKSIVLLGAAMCMLQFIFAALAHASLAGKEPS